MMEIIDCKCQSMDGDGTHNGVDGRKTELDKTNEERNRGVAKPTHVRPVKASSIAGNRKVQKGCEAIDNKERHNQI